jgi:hypothetical protein
MFYNKKVKKTIQYSAIRAYAAFALLTLTLIPLLRISLYSVPWYDDFNYGMYAKSAIDEGLGLTGVLKAALETVRVQWYAWQGTYSSVFFMSLMPGIWGEKYYFLGPVFLILLLTAGVYVLMYVVLRDIFSAGRYDAAAVSAVCAAAAVMFIHSSQAGFYWYNGGVHYIGMHSFFMFFTALCIRAVCCSNRKKSIASLAAAAVFAVITAGSNYVTALQGLVVAAAFLIFIILYRKKLIIAYIPAFVLYCYGFYKNVGAPGNRFRKAAYVGWGYSPAMAVLRSFREAALHIGTFTGWRTVAVMVLLVPVLITIVSVSRAKFINPIPIIILSFALYATGFTPSLYSLGHAGLGRTLNAVKLTFQILLFIDEICVIGWICQKTGCKQDNNKYNNKNSEIPFYIVMLAVMAFLFRMSSNQAGLYSSFGAYYYVHTGEAYNFHEEYMERVDILKSDEQNVVLKGYTYRPWMLCIGDLGDNPDAEENMCVAAWYDKESVTVIYE